MLFIINVLLIQFSIVLFLAEGMRAIWGHSDSLMVRRILNTFDKFMYIIKNVNHHFANFVNVIWNKRSSLLYK